MIDSIDISCFDSIRLLLLNDLQTAKSQNWNIVAEENVNKLTNGLVFQPQIVNEVVQIIRHAHLKSKIKNKNCKQTAAKSDTV